MVKFFIQNVGIGIIILSLILLPIPMYSISYIGTYNQVNADNKLVIYTYEYFFGLTNETLSGGVYDKIFTSFENRYGVDIDIRFFSGARNIFLTALQEYKAEVRTADLLIGIDNIVVQEAKKAGILVKINETDLQNLSRIDSDLIDNFDPDLYAVPYDFSPIAFIYDTQRINLTELKFEDFYNQTLASYLVVEDPTLSTTGVSFLLWQIGVYEKILEKDWKEWWSKIKDNIIVTKSWGEAYYSYFLNEQEGRPIVVSYLTSPVYHGLYENTTRYRPMLVKYNDRWYSWFQIQGIGIVKGSPMVDMALKFIDWLLSDEVQSLVAENDIMLPASTDILNSLPENIKQYLVYNISEIEPVNNLVSVQEVYDNIDTWLSEWQEVMTAGPSMLPLYMISLVATVAIIGVLYMFYRRKRVKM